MGRRRDRERMRALGLPPLGPSVLSRRERVGFWVRRWTGRVVLLAAAAVGLVVGVGSWVVAAMGWW